MIPKIENYRKIVGKEIIEKIKADFSPLNFIPVNISIHVDSRLIQFAPSFGIVDGHTVDFSAFLALADRVEFGELREGLMQRF